ncbi:MAG: 30S ribosomal protein S1 [Candidatus Omnitrophica bacterium]|nr:30S ribosomal protein S1 [Candidatus Omnitrophota bacterium]
MFGKLKQKNLEKIYEDTLKEFKEGEIVKGEIVSVTPKEVLVDIGYKSEGCIPLSEFSDPKAIKVGDKIDVLLESKENEDGMVVLSKWKADRKIGWERIMNDYKEGDIIEGTVNRKVKGGLMVDIGLDAFLPASLVALRGFPNLDQFMRQRLKFKIVKINKARRNIVLSRKDVLRQEKEQTRDKLIHELKKGEIRQGVVKNITDFGAFIDLGGVDGLLHITDMSWGRVSHPSEIVALGDKIEVMILDIDKENTRVSLGLKQKMPSPWEKVNEKYPVGTKIKGKVVNILPYGAFIELEKGLEGLVHISELSWSRRINHPNEVLAIGDVVEAIVLNADSAAQKISLGIKQMEANPWLKVAERYPIGSRVKGKIHTLTEYGAFVELEEGIDGLIHISDMSWTKRLMHPEEILKKGQKIEATVLSVDQDNRKIALGLKQLEPDPWPELIKRFPAGLELEGTVTKVTNFGVFVEIEKDIEALLHISEVPGENKGKPAEIFKVGDKVKTRVAKSDSTQHKITLTQKE